MTNRLKKNNPYSTCWKMSLQEEIDTARAEIRSDSYGVSIGECISLYENDELDIHPEFQRK